MLAPVRIDTEQIYPVTLDEAKQHVGAVGFTSDDGEIKHFIAAATSDLERTLNMAFALQDWRQDISCFSGSHYLYPNPVRAITAVTYRDINGAVATLPESAYALYADASGSFLEFLSADLPITAIRRDAISITYQCGYSDGMCHPALRAAILIYVGYLYGHRGQPDLQAIDNIPACEKLIFSFRKPRV